MSPSPFANNQYAIWFSFLSHPRQVSCTDYRVKLGRPPWPLPVACWQDLGTLLLSRAHSSDCSLPLGEASLAPTTTVAPLCQDSKRRHLPWMVLCVDGSLGLQPGQLNEEVEPSGAHEALSKLVELKTCPRWTHFQKSESDLREGPPGTSWQPGGTRKSISSDDTSGDSSSRARPLCGPPCWRGTVRPLPGSQGQAGDNGRSRCLQLALEMLFSLQENCPEPSLMGRDFGRSSSDLHLPTQNSRRRSWSRGSFKNLLGLRANPRPVECGWAGGLLGGMPSSSLEASLSCFSADSDAKS